MTKQDFQNYIVNKLNQEAIPLLNLALSAKIFDDFDEFRSLKMFAEEMLELGQGVSNNAISLDSGKSKLTYYEIELRKKIAEARKILEKEKLTPIHLTYPTITPEVPKIPIQSELPIISKAPVFDPGLPSPLEIKAPDVPNIFDDFVGGGKKAEVIAIPDEVRQIESSPDPVALLSTPRPGTVPVAAGTTSWADLISTLFSGFSTAKQIELQKKLVRSPHLYVTPQTQMYVSQQKRLPWGWIGGGLGLLALAGVGIFLLAKKK